MHITFGQMSVLDSYWKIKEICYCPLYFSSFSFGHCL